MSICQAHRTRILSNKSHEITTNKNRKALKITEKRRRIAYPHAFADDTWKTVFSIQKGAMAYAQKHFTHTHIPTYTHLFSSAYLSVQFALFATARSSLFLIYRIDRHTQVSRQSTNAHNGRCVSVIYVVVYVPTFDIRRKAKEVEAVCFYFLLARQFIFYQVIFQLCWHSNDAMTFHLRLLQSVCACECVIRCLQLAISCLVAPINNHFIQEAATAIVFSFTKLIASITKLMQNDQ